ncbi:MAG: chromate transporter [Clostridiales bacterium]|nr:chromate transporter [Clostridiales bacterium]
MWVLFTSSLYLSSVTFGGGYVIIPLLSKRFCDQLHWIDEKEVVDLAAIAQTAPGSIAVNASILMGYRVAGVPGALICMLGTVLPPLAVICAVYAFYRVVRDHPVARALMRGMRAAVAAVILDVAISMQWSLIVARDWLPIAMLAACFVLAFFVRVDVAFLLLGAALIGVGAGWWARKKAAA